MSFAKGFHARIPVMYLVLYLGSFLITAEVRAQYNPKSSSKFFIGARAGINLTNYAKPLDKVRTNVAKPIGGFFVERTVTSRFSGQLGLSYAPYTIKWTLYSSANGGVAVVNFDHLHFLQTDLKGLYRLQSNSKARLPILLSGGAFLSKLADAYVVNYYPKQNETYRLNDTDIRPAWNAGIVLGVQLQKTFPNGSMLRFGGEWIRGLSSIHNDPMAAASTSRPKSRAYSFTFNYGIQIGGKRQ
jgi:hypothetical protein